MIVRNRRNDLAYKREDHIVMLHNSMDTLSTDNKIVYTLISNFEEGLDVKYIYELMNKKGWEISIIDNAIKGLLNMNLIEEVSHDVDLNKIKMEFEEFKKHIGII